jgi:selenium-binding protein 1
VFAGGYDHHSTSSDFFAVIDAEPSSPRYATIVATAPIGASGTQPHHMELTMPAGGRWLFANGFMSGRIFLFDLADPFHPRLASTIDSISSFRNPTAFGA